MLSFEARAANTLVGMTVSKPEFRGYCDGVDAVGVECELDVNTMCGIANQ